MMDRIGRERGWPPMSRAAFEASRRLEGANLVGSPAEVAEKILFQHSIFGHDRFLIQFSVGTLPHADVMRSIELFGTEVAPLVRRELSPAPAEADAPDGRLHDPGGPAVGQGLAGVEAGARGRGRGPVGPAPR